MFNSKKNTRKYLPITMQQFEDLTNEMTLKVNELTTPHFLQGDYVAQIVMSAIHALPHSEGMYDPEGLFESVVNRISNHVSYMAVDAITQKIEAANALAKAGTTPDVVNNVVSLTDGNASTSTNLPS